MSFKDDGIVFIIFGDSFMLIGVWGLVDLCREHASDFECSLFIHIRTRPMDNNFMNVEIEYNTNQKGECIQTQGSESQLKWANRQGIDKPSPLVVHLPCEGRFYLSKPLSCWDNFICKLFLFNLSSGQLSIRRIRLYGAILRVTERTSRKAKYSVQLCLEWDRGATSNL